MAINFNNGIDINHFYGYNNFKRTTNMVIKGVIHMKISKQKIEMLQAARKMTATKLAELSGVTRQQISTIKQRGTCQPWTAQKLADAFGVSLESIIETEG
ncbi:XRE family transcriptional regulator [[Clostridium] leptum]|uniref:XRE family transcriptional regulator n=1 Tax=[Clostridium] leptum TaxID=1535 RepID=A0A412AWS5_9FIRM|nr:XRE family transcriptional regulator [[Clostridium] leptum]